MHSSAPQLQYPHVASGCHIGEHLRQCRKLRSLALPTDFAPGSLLQGTPPPVPLLWLIPASPGSCPKHPSPGLSPPVRLHHRNPSVCPSPQQDFRLLKAISQILFIRVPCPAYHVSPVPSWGLAAGKFSVAGAGAGAEEGGRDPAGRTRHHVMELGLDPAGRGSH